VTYSLVARDPDGHTFGAVTASKYLAVGSTVPAVAAGVGALVTQGLTNVSYRERGLRFLRAGQTAARTVELLVEADPGRDTRQVAVVAASGSGAAATGSRCVDQAGHLLADGCAVAGNMMADLRVLDAMLERFTGSSGALADRLVDALAAGEAAGGDWRGRQSAALVVASGQGMLRLRTPDRVDLRVDDHPDPVAELRRLLERHHVLVGEPDPGSAIPLVDAALDEVEQRLRAVLPPGTAVEGTVADLLRVWARRENLQHRLLEGLIDVAVLEELRRRSPS
jgi:uncharacterized Ntn-hydrolase superfamily protein